MPESMPADPRSIVATSIAIDGTIAGRNGNGLVLWHPQTQAWDQQPKPLRDAAVFISPDGSSVLAMDDSQQPEPTNTLVWNHATGWQVLAGSTADQSVIYNVSRNFRFATGSGGDFGNPYQAWVWDIDGGVQHLLPTLDSSFNTFASAVSEDGSVVVGNGLRFPRKGGDWPESVAVRWIEDGPATTLRDPDGNELYEATACNADCSIIFGSSVLFGSNAWFLKSDGAFGFLGTLADGDPALYQYYVGDVSADGSLVVGIYSAKARPDDRYSNDYAFMPFLWTPTTGMVSLRSLGIEVDWGGIPIVRLSSDGRLVLVASPRELADDPVRSRAAVLHLTPKAARPDGGHSAHGQPASQRPARNGFLRTGSKAAID